MATSTFESTADAIKSAAARIGDATSRVQDTASALGHRAVSAIDAQRANAANGLDGTATGLHATAGYIRENRVKDMVADVTAYVKAHPAQALIGAVAVGFIAGRMLRRT